MNGEVTERHQLDYDLAYAMARADREYQGGKKKGERSGALALFEANSYNEIWLRAYPVAGRGRSLEKYLSVSNSGRTAFNKLFLLPWPHSAKKKQQETLDRWNAFTMEEIRDDINVRLGQKIGRRKLEFEEGWRQRRETHFFARNASLVKEAKKHYGCTCMACGFNFETAYGKIGEGYAECHHRNPLSERPEKEWTARLRTNLEDVDIVCANCHRMLHRQRPAISVVSLRAIMNAIRPSATI